MKGRTPMLLAAGGLSTLLMALSSPRASAKVSPGRTAPPQPAGDAHAPLPGRPAAGSGFGVRTDPITKQPSFHRGIDIPVPVGTPVYAPWSGSVVRVDRDGVGLGVANGNAVYLRARGYLWAFLHLSTVAVRVGDTVQRGQVLGRTGQTGRTTGPHLHVQVYAPDGQLIDPRSLFPAATFARSAQ